MARAGKDIKSVITKSRTTQDLHDFRSLSQEVSAKRPTYGPAEAPPDDVEINSLISTIESQRAALDMRAKGMLSLQSDIMSMGKLLEEEKRRRAADTQQVQKLVTENGRLRFQISELTNSFSAQQKLQADLEDQLKTLQRELEAKNKQLETAQAKAKTGSALQSEVDALRDRENGLVKVLNAQRTEVQDLTRQLEDLQRQCVREKTQSEGSLQETSAALRDLTQQKVALEAQWAALQAQLTSQLAETARLQADNDSLQSQVDSLAAELFVKSQELLKLVEIEKKMSESFETLQSKEAALASKYKAEVYNSKLLSEKRATLEAQLAEKATEVVDLKPWEEKVKGLQSRLTEQVALAERADERLRVFVKEAEAEKLIFQQKTAAAAERLETANREKHALQAKCDELLALLQGKDQQSGELATLRHQLQITSDLNLRLTAQVSDLTKRAEALHSDALSKDALFAHLQQERDAEQASLARDLSSMRIKLRANDATIDELQGKLNKEKTARVQVQEDYSRLLSEKSDVSSTLKSQLLEFRAKVAQLEIELASAKDAAEKHAQRTTALQAEVETLTADNARLKSAAETSSQDLVAIDLMKKHVSAQFSKLQTLEADLDRGVSLLETATQSLEGNTTCYTCLELLKDAVMCVPCGHVFCQKCKEKSRTCSECGVSKPVASVVRVGLIDTISGKVGYSKQVVESMRQALSRIKEIA